ncbi:MAG: ribosome-associated translation inhibitor RaiA [Anaerolineales bacterium]|nr:ribosome-associated translation inhibitor RaiA [Anaerolineales bacterium]
MTVKVVLNGHNIEINEKLEDYATKKVSKLDHYLDSIEEAFMDLKFDKNARNANDRQVAQLTVRGRGTLLRAEVRTDDIFNSIDAVMDKMYRQIERYKGKRRRSRGDGRSLSDMIAAPVDLTEDEMLEPQIVRRKKFMLTSMNEQEAIEQMLLLGHENFFIFLNGNTTSVNVLYRRHDGTLGIIEPEID